MILLFLSRWVCSLGLSQTGQSVTSDDWELHSTAESIDLPTDATLTFRDNLLEITSNSGQQIIQSTFFSNTSLILRGKDLILQIHGVTSFDCEPIFLSVVEDAQINFVSAAFPIPIEITNSARLTLNVSAAQVIMDGPLNLRSDLTVFSIRDSSTELQFLSEIDFGSNSQLFVRGPRDFDIKFGRLHFTTDTLPIVFLITELGLPHVTAPNSSVWPPFSALSLVLEELVFDFVTNTTFVPITFPAGYSLPSTFAVRLPETGTFGFTEHDSLLEWTFANNSVVCRFDANKTYSIVNRICYGDATLCHNFTRCISDPGDLVTLSDALVPAWTRNLHFFLMRPTHEYLDLNLLPGINLAVIGTSSNPTINLRSSGAVKNANYLLMHIEFDADENVVFGSPVTFSDCVMTQAAQKTVSFQSDVMMSFSTLQTVTIPQMFSKATSLFVGNCTLSAIYILFDTDLVRVSYFRDVDREVSIPLPDGLPALGFGLTAVTVTLRTVPWSAGFHRKTGLAFSGTGLVRFDEGYNLSVPDRSPLHFGVGVITLDLSHVISAPPIVVDPLCRFSYTLPHTIDAPFRAIVPNSAFPVRASQVDFSEIATIDLVPRETNVSIDTVNLAIGAHVTVSSLIVVRSLTLGRGSSLGPMGPNLTVSLTNQTSLVLMWRGAVLPMLALSEVVNVVPRSIELQFDVPDERFINMTQYIDSFYGRRHALITGVPADVCPIWLSTVRFVGVSPFFHGSSSLFSVFCTGEYEATISLGLERTIPLATPLPSESPTPFGGMPNAIEVLSGTAFAFAALSVAIGVAFIYLKRRLGIFRSSAEEYLSPGSELGTVDFASGTSIVEVRVPDSEDSVTH
jgi:hypothetical protein